RCGPLEEREHLVLDYDLFCRFSRHYRFHVLDAVLANYRLHGTSKTCAADGGQVLEESIRVSRKYWRDLPPWERLALGMAYLRFRLDGRRRAMGLLRTAQECARRRRWPGVLGRLAVCLVAAPDVVADVCVLPLLAERTPRLFNCLRGLGRLWQQGGRPAQTQGYPGWHTLHPDRWAGPVLEMPVTVAPGQRELRLEGRVEIGYHTRPLRLTAYLDGRWLGGCVCRGQRFCLEAPLAVTPGEHRLRVEASSFLVLDDF